MNKLYLITLTALIISLFINFKSCNKDNNIVDNIEFIEGEKDTVFVKITDTVFNLKPVYVQSKKIFVKDTFYLKDSIVYFNDSLLVNEFKTEYEDSLIKAVITSNVKGFLLNTDLSYSYNNKIISSTDTIIKTVLFNKNKFYLGAFYGNNSINPSVLFSYKNKFIFKASYNINNNYPYIGAYYNIK